MLLAGAWRAFGADLAKETRFQLRRRASGLQWAAMRDVQGDPRDGAGHCTKRVNAKVPGSARVHRDALIIEVD